MNKLQFPAASPSSRPPSPASPHTPGEQTSTWPFPQASPQPIPQPHHVSPPPGSDSSTHQTLPHPPPFGVAAASPGASPPRFASEPATPGARTHTHSHASLTSLPAPRPASSAGTQPGRGRGVGTQVCARSAPSRRASRSPRLPAGKREDTATPPPPRTYHLCLLLHAPNLRPAPPLRTGPASTLTGDTARSAGSSSAAASSREASARLSGSSERPRGTAGAGGRRHLPLLRLLLARRGWG